MESAIATISSGFRPDDRATHCFHDTFELAEALAQTNFKRVYLVTDRAYRIVDSAFDGKTNNCPYGSQNTN